MKIKLLESVYSSPSRLPSEIDSTSFKMVSSRFLMNRAQVFRKRLHERKREKGPRSHIRSPIGRAQHRWDCRHLKRPKGLYPAWFPVSIQHEKFVGDTFVIVRPLQRTFRRWFSAIRRRFFDILWTLTKHGPTGAQ